MSVEMVTRLDRPAPGHYQGRLSAVLSSATPAASAPQAWWSGMPRRRHRQVHGAGRAPRQGQLALPLDSP